MEAKPCPFCMHSTVTVYPTNPAWMDHCSYVMCENCGAEGPSGNDEDEALEKWNSRPWRPPE